MDKELLKSFLRWLDHASPEVIEERRKEFERQRSRVSTKEGLRDLNLGLRLIDEEILARLSTRRLRR